MAKDKTPTTEELLAKIASLEEKLAEEKKFNRKLVGLPEETPDKDLLVEVPWSNEWMQRETDRNEVVNGAVTDVYDRRVFKLFWLKSGTVLIDQQNGEAARLYGLKYRKKRLKITLNENAFFMLLELMQYAAQEFGSNRDEVVAKLTEGKGIKIKRVINAL